MKITQSYFENILKNKYLFEKNPNIAVSVSGGPDSMCLLFLLNNWIKKNNGSLVALIIDHQLRHKSNVEAKFINNYLSNLNITSKIVKLSTIII